MKYVPKPIWWSFVWCEVYYYCLFAAPVLRKLRVEGFVVQGLGFRLHTNPKNPKSLSD